jgi:hypothetical protein
VDIARHTTLRLRRTLSARLSHVAWASHGSDEVERRLRFTEDMRSTERLVTLVSGTFLLAVFCYIQFEVRRTLIGSGA